MARKQKKYHFIYKTTNLLSGKYYIGMHSTDDLEDGYLGSGKRLRYSVNKYGEENHKREILEFVDSREELAKRESEIVNLNEIAKVDCMNLTVGGHGAGFMSEEHEKKFHEGRIQSLKERWNNEEYRKQALKNLKDGHRKAVENGKFNGRQNFKGKKHSDETKQLISEIRKGTGTGKSNSQHGTCWVTNSKEVKKIKKEDLDSYVNNGWRRGRK